MLLRIITLLLLTVGAASAQQNPAHLILISFDGFRYDYVQNINPPNFKAFIQKGAQAKALIPSFPSKTFPNHYTLVTGLYPAHHGLVDNRFFDAKKNEMYDMKAKKQVADPDYYGGIPIWQLARQQGMKSASYFWVGSEMSDSARRPNYYYPFDDSKLPEERVEQALSWLKLPAAERPRIITLYFSSPDHEGHTFGPSAEETRNAVFKADTLLGKLMEGLSKIDLPVNVVIVSDHGMTELEVAPETFTFVEDIINPKDPAIRMAVTGTLIQLYVSDSKKRDSVYTTLKSKEKNFTVYRKEDLPLHWHYQSSRVGDLIVSAHPGHYIRDGSWEKFFKKAELGKKFGVHGFDPEKEPNMRGIFYAQGPNIKPGITIGEFQNIHIYPLLAKILGLKVPPVDGDEKVLEKIYRK